jgi:multiple sugar transport system permease protein
MSDVTLDSRDGGWMSLKRRAMLKKVALYSVLAIIGCIMIVPFFWMIFGAFKTAREIRQIPPTFFPSNWTFENFKIIFDAMKAGKMPLPTYYYNSAFIAIWNVGITLLTCSLLGYVFAKFEFRGKQPFFWFIMSTMMVPFQVTMIPGYLLLSKLHLVNTRWGLIIPNLIDAFGIFLMQQFAITIPDSLLESARIDGAGELKIYSHIVLPQMGPALATLGMLTFMFNWNSYLWPLIILKEDHLRTLPIILYYFQNQNAQRLHLTMAASILVIFPMLIVFLLGQRWIVKGFTLSGLKG